ncbi:tetratricopeptide repeat-containing sensor histidine kinase [Hwangdonia lutea]|uniref:histidine kinase n=1 Tax=Hwangdonia lutea TaxID=3075823 RepID=A0AA97EPF0_9FLAO|nr:tetratricopeptide repeat protein [Hwangdonia sp. SCSIO 19198]WOD44120.1 tetratricopeptide repeat protein [Hwangdonia sp. SCSIO 19198]
MIKKQLSILFLIFGFCVYSQNNSAKIDSLKTIVATSKNPEEKADALNHIVDEYFDLSKDSAEFYINKTLKFTENKKALENIHIHGLLKYAQLYIVKGDYETSATYYDKAWTILKNEYNYDLYTKYYGDLGVLSFYKGDFKTALQNFEKALQLAEEDNNEEDQLRFLNNKALAMSYLGKAEPSLKVHKKAIELAEKLNDSTSLGKSFNNIGLIYEDMKEYEKALEFYLEALEIKKNGKSKVDVANSLFNVAGMYKEIGEKNNDTLLYAKAEKHYKLAIEKSEEIDYGKVILFSKTGMAQLATVRNKPLKAIKIYESVVEAAKKANDNQTLRVTYLNLGVNHLKINNLKQAEVYLLKAEPLIVEAENPSDMASVFKNLSVLYKTTNNVAKALEYFEKQYEVEKKLSNNSLKDKISEFEVKYETEKKEKEILLQRADIAEKELNLNRKNTQLFGLGILAIIIAILGYLLFNQQKLKNAQLKKEGELKEALVKIETQNRLQEQRLRISRDLHDNIGAQLTFIISSIDNLKYGFKINNDKLTSKLSSISDFTKDTIYELRDTIWAMNKSEISLEDLQARVSNFVDKASVSANKTSFNFNIDQSLSNDLQFSSVTGMNIYRIIQEAINNAIKYAQASTINVEIKKQENSILFAVTDDGVGFNSNEIEAGNGLNNIKKRAADINADIVIDSAVKQGTTVKLKV